MPSVFTLEGPSLGAGGGAISIPTRNFQLGSFGSTIPIPQQRFMLHGLSGGLRGLEGVSTSTVIGAVVLAGGLLYWFAGRKPRRRRR